MRWIDIKESLVDFLREFKSQKGGILGLCLLISWVIIALAAPIITSPEVPENWVKDKGWESIWVGIPKAAPPSWASPNLADTQITKKSVTLPTKFTVTYEVQTDTPSDFIIKGVENTILSIKLKRPDGKIIPLIENLSETEPVFQAFNDPEVKQNVITWIVNELEKEGISINEDIIFEIQTGVREVTVPTILFGKLNDEILTNPQLLPGKYEFIVEMKSGNNEKVSRDITCIVVGKKYGLLGTDTYGRDIFAGIVWGARVSITIGIIASVFSVLIGVFYGVTSAYLGGLKDEFMQRINEFVASLPWLPIMILIGIIFGNLTLSWIVILIVAFGWVGVAKVARSMALQIKEQTYIEAAKALGAGVSRIILKHIIPQLLPYAFASIALSVPGAVLTEASLSYLGLGDPTAVTWGRILHDAQTASATINGYWWWVIPPGLAIALVSLTFVLIGTALDRVLNPRLKRL